MPSQSHAQKSKKKEQKMREMLEARYAEHIQKGSEILTISLTQLIQIDSTGKVTNQSFYFDTQELISCTEYYENASGQMHGPAKFWTRNKILSRQGIFQDGEEIGEWLHYNNTGEIASVTKYKSLSGDTVQIEVFSANGELLKTSLRNGIEEVYTFRKTPEDPDEVLEFADKMAEFPGGETALQKFLSSELRYPLEALENGIQGREFMQFITEPDGSITNIKCARCHGQCIEDELTRVLLKMPKWIPGTHNEKPVRLLFTIPITLTMK
jgi:hypothetical protein